MALLEKPLENTGWKKRGTVSAHVLEHDFSENFSRVGLYLRFKKLLLTNVLPD